MMDELDKFFDMRAEPPDEPGAMRDILNLFSARSRASLTSAEFSIASSRISSKSSGSPETCTDPVSIENPSASIVG